MNRFPLAVVLLGASLTGACAANKAYNPLVAGPTAMTSVRTIALSSTELPKGLRDSVAVRQQFDTIIAAELKTAGYQVISPDRVNPVWHALSDTVRLYSASTGELDVAKLSGLMQAMSREMKTRFGADAWLLPDLRVRAASYQSGWCHWDGTKQYVQTKGELLKLSLLGMTKSGSVPALSVSVMISDPAGRELYHNYGGVAALVRMTAGGAENVGQQEALTDGLRNAKAVQLALQPLPKLLP